MAKFHTYNSKLQKWKPRFNSSTIHILQFTTDIITCYEVHHLPVAVHSHQGTTVTSASIPGRCQTGWRHHSLSSEKPSSCVSLCHRKTQGAGGCRCGGHAGKTLTSSKSYLDQMSLPCDNKKCRDFSHEKLSFLFIMLFFLLPVIFFFFFLRREKLHTSEVHSITPGLGQNIAPQTWPTVKILRSYKLSKLPSSFSFFFPLRPFQT